MFLTAQLAANYGRVEAKFPSVDLIACTARRALNLTEDWLLSVISQEDWENGVKEILTTTLSDEEQFGDIAERWGEPDDDGRGSFTLERNDEPPASNFNFSSAG